MSEEQLLGTTTVADRWRISLIKRVRKEFEEMDQDVQIGDQLAFKRVDGKVVVEPS